MGGISNHWTAAVARQHPAVERSSIIDYEEWQVLYEESDKLLKKSDDLFKEVLNETYKEEITESECLPQNLPLAGVWGSTQFYTGRFRPEVQPITLLYTILDKKGTPFRT